MTTKDDGREKAPLVVQGCQEKAADRVVKDSPTCNKETFRAVVAVFASHKWVTAKALDVKTAFLQGVPIRREVAIEPPKDLFSNGNEDWLLKKCVYGLQEASRH